MATIYNGIDLERRLGMLDKEQLELILIKLIKGDYHNKTTSVIRTKTLRLINEEYKESLSGLELA
jgi:hypothetical protein